MKYFYLYISLFISLLLYNNYSSNENFESNTNSFQAKDSISIWIESSKNKSIPYIKRKAYLDKVINKLKIETNDSLRNSLLLKISLTYYNLNDSLGFRNTNKQSIELSHKLNDSASLADNYWDLAEFYSKNSIKDSAYYYFSKSQKLYELLKNDYYSGRMLLNMAIIQSDIKDYTGSEITTIKAITLLKPLKKYKHLYRSYNNLAIVFDELEEYDEALFYHNKALKTQEEIESNNTYKENTLNNIGVSYELQKRYKDAIRYYRLALKEKKLENDDAKLYSKLLDNLAYSQFKSNDTSSVKDLFYQSLKIRDSINDYLGIAINKLHLAEYYIYIKDSEKAKQYALETKQIATETKNFRELLPALLLLSKLDEENSVTYTNQYIKLNDSLQKEERATRNKFARIQFETDEFIDENKRLNQQRNLIISISGVVLLFGFLLYVIKNQRSKNKELKFEQQQQRANEEIYNLMMVQQNKLDEGSRKEKLRISEELHDGVLGKLFGTRLLLESLNSNQDSESIQKREKYISDLQEIEEEVRNVSHELNIDSLIPDFGFINMINNFLEQQSEVTKFAYVLKHDENIVWEKISGGVKMNLYRIIQEATQNINKYAKAKNVGLEFKMYDNYLALLIKDDGIGFNPKVKSKGIGLRNMESRAAKLKGKLSVISEIKKGTLITISIPHEENF